MLAHPQVCQTRFLILDTNGEYRSAFQEDNGDAGWSSAIPDKQTLYIPTDTNEDGKLVVPYWFMDSEDFVRLFRAAPGVQRPVLLHALSSARQASGSERSWIHYRDILLAELNRILALTASGDKGDAKQIRQLCDGASVFIEMAAANGSTSELEEHYAGISAEAMTSLFVTVSDIVREEISSEGTRFESYAPVDAGKRSRIETQVQPILSQLARLPSNVESVGMASADMPAYFGKQSFRYEHLEGAIGRNESNSARTSDNCSTMLMRIYRLLEDPRFDFLFGPASAELPNLRNVLAAFLRDILGLGTSEAALSSETDPQGHLLPFYERQQRANSGASVVIIDLSLLASEVMENVTALIGRLIHEFLQRLSDPISDIKRGEFPVVLVLEEAQNYIRESRRTEDESISKLVFERIAREGRKFGLGLVVASQRPSELSKTVLSQCNSFIVHRLQNPEDLRYFREIVPGIYGQLLDQLPALAPRSALVLGECVQAPALVEMRLVDPPPRSKNPKFFKSWTTGQTMPNVEAVCAKWEGADSSTVAELVERETSAPDQIVGAAPDDDFEGYDPEDYDDPDEENEPPVEDEF